jgi:hypothetical protein
MKTERPTSQFFQRWFIVLAALAVLPWIAIGTLVLTRERGVELPLLDAPPSDAELGPWGHFTAHPLVVSPPLEYVSTVRHPLSRGLWGFPNTTPQAVEAFLASTGMAASQLASLRATIRPDARISGVTLTPDPDVVRGLAAEVRARLYAQLAKFPGNVDQTQAFRFAGGSFEDWLEGGALRETTRDLVRPLLYRDGRTWFFADMNLVRDQLDAEELRRLHKVMFRRATWLLTLRVDRSEDVRDLAQYWGVGGRRTDVQALLESVVGMGQRTGLDIVHLLPPIARNNLYRYPKLTPADLERPVLANCLWTALNFFNDHPDSRFLDVAYSLDVLKNDYYVVRGGLQLGDVMAFLDTAGNVFHVAVYVADDFVFTKNGFSAMAPWTLSKVEDVKEHYRSITDNPQIVVNRNKRF